MGILYVYISAISARVLPPPPLYYLDPLGCNFAIPRNIREDVSVRAFDHLQVVPLHIR